MFLDLFKVQEHVISSQYVREYPGATAENQEDELRLHVKQYIPRDGTEVDSGAITIIGAHANGFPKELYEPLWEELYKRLKRSEIAIRSIWIADVAHQGMSAVLNEDKLGNDPSWNDNARDLLHMTNHFRKEMPRPLIGIGHSMGASNLVQLSIFHPRLLSTLVLIDPVIRLHSSSEASTNVPDYAQLSTFRRDIWPSRAEAAAAFERNPFYRSWDRRVLELWIKYGLRDLPTAIYPISQTSSTSSPPVTLTTPKHQEVFTFLRPNFHGQDSAGKPILNRRTHPDKDSTLTHPFYRPEMVSTYHSLPHLRPSALYIFGSESELSSPEMRSQKLAITGTGIGGSGGVAEGHVRDVVLEGVGHLIPMDAVGACADAAADWVAEETRRWWREETEWRHEWAQRTRVEKCTVSEEWKMRIGGDPKAKTPRL